jgi:hypothetical protein
MAQRKIMDRQLYSDAETSGSTDLVRTSPFEYSPRQDDDIDMGMKSKETALNKALKTRISQ